MSGNYDHLTNTELADMLARYNLYATSRGADIPGPVMLKLLQKRLRETEPKPNLYPVPKQPLGTTLTIIGERIAEKSDNE